MQRRENYELLSCWRMLASAFLWLLLCWTTCSGSGGALAASIQPPGDMTPEPLEIEIGANANITCHIVGIGDSSSIWFREENLLANTSRNITQQSTEIILLDNQTAVFAIRNAVEFKGRYTCMSGNSAIGLAHVYVGTPPKRVTDFSCKGYDYEFLKCRFKKPENMVPTNYTLKYRTNANSENYGFVCKLEIDDHVYYCNITSASENHLQNPDDPLRAVYQPIREMYYFNLTGTNVLGSYAQIEPVNNYKSVVPAKLNIELRNITDNSVTLHWELKKCDYYKVHGLEYEIRVQPDGFDSYIYTDYEECKIESCYIPLQELRYPSCNILLRGLKYPYREYAVSVRVKVKTAKNEDGSMWSEIAVNRFRTEPRRPDAPPTTATGGFYIDSAGTEVRLYWQQLADYERNGPDFQYAIQQVDADGKFFNTIYTNESYIRFPWQRQQMLTYYIKAANRLGATQQSSVLRVFPSSGNHAPSTVATVYHNRMYTVTWKPPRYQAHLLNYTIFWCLSKIESANQCRGSIHFKYLDKYQINFTTDAQDHTLNLAVSANYADSSSGMNWAMCSAADSSDLMKLEPKATAWNATAIRVQWSPERVCTSILKGYNLTYCQVADNASTSSNSASAECTTAERTVELLLLHDQKEYKEFLIPNLEPYSVYRIGLLMYSNTKVGPMSDALYVRTKEAAPTPPRSLNVSAVTSNAAIITWLPPKRTNGQLQYYTIWKVKVQNSHKDHQRVSINETNVDRDDPRGLIVFKLESLNSYSEYEVYVTAHTVEASAPSNTIKFSTLIGIPTNPRELTIKEDERYGELKWNAPEMPSGRVEFYVIAIVTEHIKGRRNERIALVQDNSCRFRKPECPDSSYSYFLRVRAVNVAAKHEIDHSTFSIVKASRKRRDTNPEINARLLMTTVQSTHNISSTAATMHSNKDGFAYDVEPASPTPPLETTTTSMTVSDVDDSFECIGAKLVEPRYRAYLKHLNDVIGGSNEEEFKFFASPWEDFKNIYKCSDVPLEMALTIVGMVIVFSAVLGLAWFWCQKKYKEMKNIKAVLPVGLLDQMPTYKLGGSGSSDGYDNNTDKEHSDISRSIESLIFQHKEHHQLLNCNDSMNVLSSLATNNSRDYSNSDTPAKDAREERLSTQSTDSVELNDVSSSGASYSHHRLTPVKRSSSCGSEDDFVGYQAVPPLQAAGAPQAASNVVVNPDAGGGYVTPATLMSATNPPEDAPTAAPFVSGYVQPQAVMMLAAQQPAPTHSSGYITLDAMGKPTTTTTTVSTAALPTIATTAVTSLAGDDLPNLPQHKLPLTSSNNAQDDATDTNQNNNNNNESSNTICGYIKPRQLQDFSQLLH